MSTFAVEPLAVRLAPSSPRRPLLLPNQTRKPSVDSLPMAQKQVLQRLGQLVAWQEKQRAILLQQQQQEIEQLQQVHHKGTNNYQTDRTGTGEPVTVLEDSPPPDIRPLPPVVSSRESSTVNRGTAGTDERPIRPLVGTYEDYIDSFEKPSETERVEANRINVSPSLDGKEVEDCTKSSLHNRKEVVPRESTPLMSHSQDSFILRRDARLELEHEELMEFEMLENAAENSLLSQFSLSQSSVQPTMPLRLHQLRQHTHGRQQGQVEQQRQSQHVHPDLQEQQEKGQQSIEEQQQRMQWRQHNEQQLNSAGQLVKTSGSSPSFIPRPDLGVRIEEEVAQVGSDDDEDNRSVEDHFGPGRDAADLDNTLKGSPSLAKGVDFDDDEAWESFSQRHTDHSLSRCDSQSSLSVASSDGILPALSSSPAVKQSSPHKTTVLPPPPTSALVSRLFPALTKVEERYPKPTNVSSKNAPPRSAEAGKASSPVSSAGGDSGFSGASERGSEVASHLSSSACVGISEELKRKLSELEQEIARYRKENQSLETLRKEREQSLAYLRDEIAEFKKQQEEEVKQFETYKSEEVNKLRKERRVFESYKTEALAARNKKDKEDIENLRRELKEAREELKVREARWGSTMARYRVRIESLEAENKELQSDLRMMEQERLQVWQMQLEKENKEKENKEKENKEKERVKKSSPHKEKKVNQENKEKTVTVKKSSPGIEKKKSTQKSVRKSSPGKRQVRLPLHETGNQLTPQKSTNPSNSSPVKTQAKIESNHKPLSKEEDIGLGAPPSSIPEDRLPSRDDRDELSQQGETSPGQKTVLQPDGSKVITFSNGTRKVIDPDGKSSSVYFFNGDIKHVKPDDTVVYFYSEFKVTQTNYLDGLEVIEFPNGQSEHHYPDGTKEIHFPNDTVKFLYPNGEEECVFPDGLKQHHFPNGDVTLHMANGIKEFYSTKFKRREYPDGTTKTVYPDGKQETRYASGRIRVKDKTGKILTDSNKT